MDSSALYEPERPESGVCDLDPQDFPLDESVTSQSVSQDPQSFVQSDSLSDSQSDSMTQSFTDATNGDGDPDDSAANIVATWADEFYRMASRKPAPPPQLPETLGSFPIDSPLDFGVFQSSPAPQLPPTPQLVSTPQPHRAQPGILSPQSLATPQPQFVPSPVSNPPPREPPKQYDCVLCKTTYGTPGRLKRHYGTKKHKALSEKLSVGEAPPKPAPIPPPPPQVPEKLPDIPALTDQSPVTLPHMPQFRSYADFAQMSPSVDPYSADWTVFHNQLDFFRNQQSITSDPHHPQNLFFQPHINPDGYYAKIPFSTLCNSHQSSLNHQPPQYLPEGLPSQDPRYPPTSFYSPQTPTPSWYYPVTPYPSPNPYLQRHHDFPTPQSTENYPKFEANNNFQEFDQRPYQQEALNLWTPKPLEIEGDPSDDDSETISPAVSPDSQHEPVSSTDCPDLVPESESPERVKCDQCNREFSQARYLNQHNSMIHPPERPYKCEQCSQSYPLMSMLERHCEKHILGGRPYRCDVCDEEFSSKHEMTRHRHLHSGAQKFTCHLCPKRCTRKDSLKRHLKVHEAQKQKQRAEKQANQVSG